jgi:hypothetical protein
VYVSPTTSDTYILNTTASSFVAAEFACNDQGGHLVTYATFAEQQEVEQVGHAAAAACCCYLLPAHTLPVLRPLLSDSRW